MKRLHNSDVYNWNLFRIHVELLVSYVVVKAIYLPYVIQNRNLKLQSEKMKKIM